ncbi:glycosyltransferase [Acaryochloris sp. IP29b_bin.137]|uniref:glycosyltransferase n=1 Tax=Acaryochloris sp. IP29b_bin.137 TaxID=2969217 RepID=UPI002626A9C7|nr:glycosyltransferase [Acaryochloris sp. IP29b_bin.137]
MSNVFVVVIGRNEGERLTNCLDSLLFQLIDSHRIVYVDSGSCDLSCEIAYGKGVQVIELDASIPFTAARARNAGWRWLHDAYPDIEYVQFVDGDCELADKWIAISVNFLENNERFGVVCGRRREKHPDASHYNRLADMEWNTPIGETMACGGDALIRFEALRSVEGYNSNLICGEEPEMCIRMRRKGWLIQRIDAEMTHHDLDMHHFGQWWKRSIRGGWAIAEGATMYGSSPERYMVREQISGWLWGLIVPLISIGLTWFTKGWSLLFLTVYLFLGLRIYLYRHHQRQDFTSHSCIYAIFCTFSKFPQVLGQLSYWKTYWRGETSTIIEYKHPSRKGV